MKRSNKLEYLVLIPAAAALIVISQKSSLFEPVKQAETRAQEYVAALPVKQDTLYGPSLDNLIFKNLPDVDTNTLFAARDRIIELNPEKFPRGKRSPTYNGEILYVPYDSTMTD
jgi:hypothetical protein